MDKITKPQIRKLIREELDDFQKTQTIPDYEKKRQASDVIANLYIMLMKGQIETAKKMLAADPHLQALATTVEKLTFDLGKKLRTDDKFLQHMSKIIDKMSAEK